MVFVKKTKARFLSLFREFFVYHHSSLEFRAKLFAVMILSNANHGEGEICVLRKLAKFIYKNNEDRAAVLVNTVIEYVRKIEETKSLCINNLIVDIDKDLKKHKRFIKKINIAHLKKFSKNIVDEDSRMLQKRVIEFFENEMKSAL